MKKSKLKYLALPLCLSFMLVGCGKAEVPESHVAETNVAVQTVYDFIEPEEKEVVLTTSLKQIDGDVVDAYKDVFLVKTIDKDVMNNVIETYKLVNGVSGKTVLTLKHEYADGAYFAYGFYDEYGNEWLPPTYMDVEIVDYSVPYLKVVKYTNTRIADEVLEKEENNNGYVITQSETYYGLDGTLIASFNAPTEVDMLSATNNIAVVAFGNMVVEMEKETGNVLKSWDGEKYYILTGFDFAGENYGVYLNDYYGQYGAITTYTLTGNLINRYVYESDQYSSYMLNNGNVLVQYYDLTVGVNCDIVFSNQKYYVRTYIVDTLSGKVTPVETDYCFTNVFTKDYIRENIQNAIIKDALLNIGVAVKMEGKEAVYSESAVVFMNSALEVSLVAENLHPEMFDYMNVRVLSNGNYALPVQGDFASYVILNANFETVRYLPLNARITDTCFILNDGIYNLNMERVYELNQNQSVRSIVGNSVIVQQTASGYYGDSRIIFVNVATDGTVDTNTFMNHSIVDAGEGYIVLQSETSKEYSLLNTTGSQVLHSIDQPEVHMFSNGNALVQVELSNGETVAYNWATANTQNGGGQ